MSAVEWVQTPDQARVAAENEARAATHAAATRAEGDARVIQLPNNYKPTPTPSDEMPLMRQALARHAQGKMKPEQVMLGPMPRRATQTMRDVAADMQLRFGLELAQGFQRPLIYAASEAEEIVGTRRGASKVLQRLCDAGVIRCVGEMPPRGQVRGTFVYVPPTWWPADPEARAIVEATGQHPNAADLIWVPDETQDVEAARHERP